MGNGTKTKIYNSGIFRGFRFFVWYNSMIFILRSVQL